MAKAKEGFFLLVGSAVAPLLPLLPPGIRCSRLDPKPGGCWLPVPPPALVPVRVLPFPTETASSITLQSQKQTRYPCGNETLYHGIEFSGLLLAFKLLRPLFHQSLLQHFRLLIVYHVPYIFFP